MKNQNQTEVDILVTGWKMDCLLRAVGQAVEILLFLVRGCILEMTNHFTTSVVFFFLENFLKNLCVPYIYVMFLFPFSSESFLLATGN